MSKQLAVKIREAGSAAKYTSRQPVSKKDGLYRVFRVQTHMLTRNIRRIQDVVLLDRVTLPGTEQGAEAVTKILKGKKIDDRANVKNRPALDNKDSSKPQKYAVEKLVAARQQHGGTQYEVR